MRARGTSEREREKAKEREKREGERGESARARARAKSRHAHNTRYPRQMTQYKHALHSRTTHASYLHAHKRAHLLLPRVPSFSGPPPARRSLELTVCARRHIHAHAHTHTRTHAHTHTRTHAHTHTRTHTGKRVNASTLALRSTARDAERTAACCSTALLPRCIHNVTGQA